MKKCSVKNCDEPVVCRNLCEKHYKQQKYKGTLPTIRPYRKKPYACKVEGCEKEGYCKGFCITHYQRFRHHGTPERINAPPGSIYINMHGYKTIRHNGKNVHLHRLIMEEQIGRPLTPDEIVHHINGDKLDNRIENLQIMTFSEHTIEHHSRRGVYDKACNKIKKSERKCSVEGCKNLYLCRGFCSPHYKQFRESGQLQLSNRPSGVKTLICEVEGCYKPQFAKGLCKNHYMLKRKYGRTNKIRRPNGVKDFPCEVEGCDNPGFCKGLCKKHYKKFHVKEHHRRGDIHN